ncbi:hypothetical protein G9A89_021321 [Geosiphon pyriformis]|nr:hypothetical protein G9A89_021321 [Geosiphon pyriformis]
MAKINHIYLHQPINSGNRKRVSATIVINKNIFKSTAATTAINNILTTTANNLSTPNNLDPTTKLIGQWSPKTKNHAAKLEIVNGSTSADPQLLQLNRILSMEFGHQKSPKPEFPELFKSSGYPKRCLTQQPGTHPKTTNTYQQYSASNTVSTRIITADEATKTPIGEINDLPIEINSIIVPIKVLIMEATQYQALVGNDWLSKINATLDWNIQELQLSQNGQHTRVPAMCGHFKATNTTVPLINFEEKKPKPTWEAYQVSWADEEHNELPPILSWDNNGKEKQTNKLTWKTDNLTWTDNKQKEASSWEWNEDKGKGKEKKEGMLLSK